MVMVIKGHIQDHTPTPLTNSPSTPSISSPCNAAAALSRSATSPSNPPTRFSISVRCAFTSAASFLFASCVSSARRTSSSRCDARKGARWAFRREEGGRRCGLNAASMYVSGVLISVKRQVRRDARSTYGVGDVAVAVAVAADGASLLCSEPAAAAASASAFSLRRRASAISSSSSFKLAMTFLSSNRFANSFCARSNGQYTFNRHIFDSSNSW